MSDKPKLERRAYNFEVRAEQTERGFVLSGRPIVYGQTIDMGWFSETIEQGALDKTDLTDVRFLVNHNTQMIPLARSRRNNANSTMQLAVDAQGLDLVRVDLDVENNADAKALYSAVQRGDITGMSFMFSIDGERWEDLDTDYPKRIITSIASVVEVSAVTWPAYDRTEIYARSKEALESARAEVLERARQAAANAPEGADINALALAKEKTKTILLSMEVNK